jgi:methylated-DNA-protein-cysteine methyltransferase-like protein
MRKKKPSTPSSEQRLTEIWKLVRKIPRGSVATYGDIARCLRPPCNPRLVGWALRNAPEGLELPWHRVLAAGGRIALPEPYGSEQRFRLRAEGVAFSGRNVALKRHLWNPPGKSLTR